MHFYDYDMKNLSTAKDQSVDWNYSEYLIKISVMTHIMEC